MFLGVDDLETYLLGFLVAGWGSKWDFVFGKTRKCYELMDLDNSVE